METVFGSPNMTVAYHVTGRDTVYPPSVVLEGLESYGRDKLIADLRQYLPLVTALPLPVAPWRARPASSFQLKTGQPVFSQRRGLEKNKSESSMGPSTYVVTWSVCIWENPITKMKRKLLHGIEVKSNYTSGHFCSGFSSSPPSSAAVCRSWR